MGREWIRTRLEKAGEAGYFFDSFVASISGLRIESRFIQGDVLVGGCGKGFPERVMLCTPGSMFGMMEKKINSLTTADSEFFTNLESLLDHSVIINRYGDQPSLKPKSVSYYPDSLQMVLPVVSESIFDTILFFRIQQLEKQLERGLINQIQRVLKPGGFLLGSGSFLSLESCRLLFDKDFNIRQTVILPNIDFSGFFYNKEHVGFCLQKRC